MHIGNYLNFTSLEKKSNLDGVQLAKKEEGVVQLFTVTVTSNQSSDLAIETLRPTSQP